MKSLARRACLFEGSARAVEAYKAEVADECLKHSDYTRVSLTFSRLFYI